MSPFSATVFAIHPCTFLAFAREMIPPLHHVHGFEKILSSAQDGRLPTTESIVSNIQTGKIVHVFGWSHLLLKLVPTSTCLPSHLQVHIIHNLKFKICIPFYFQVLTGVPLLWILGLPWKHTPVSTRTPNLFLFFSWYPPGIMEKQDNISENQMLWATCFAITLI